MAVCINKNSIEYQSLKLRAGISEFMLEAICRDFMEKYDRFPYLDELPNSNSELSLRDSLHVKENGGARISDILETTGKETVEDAVVSINNQYRDLETRILPIVDNAIVDIVHRPSEYNIEPLTEEETILARAPRNSDGQLLAPNGKVSNLTESLYVQVRTKAFKNWFGDWENNPESASKVVDENGEPLVVRHFTDEEFNTFDLSFFGQNDPGDYGRGFYFTNKRTSDDYFTGYYGPIEMNVFLNIRNPFNASTNENSRLAHLSFNRSLRPKVTKSEQIKNEIAHIEREKYITEERLFGNDPDYKKFKNPDYVGTEVETAKLKRFNEKLVKLREELNNLKEDYDINESYNTNIRNLEQYDGVFSNNTLGEIVVRNPNQIKSATTNTGRFSKINDNIYDEVPNNYLIISNALEKLANLYGITLNEVTDAELNSDLWAGLIPDASSVNAFVYNGQIYINTDRANIDAPIHEMFHILVGSMRFENPELYKLLIDSVENLYNYSVLVEQYPGRSRNDVNEEIFITELAKYFSGMPSLLMNLDLKAMHELSYNIKRTLDTILMGLDSVKTISDDRLYNMSLKDVIQEVNSTIATSKFKGFINVEGSELHRTLNNIKSDLLRNGTLEEQCD